MKTLPLCSLVPIFVVFLLLEGCNSPVPVVHGASRLISQATPPATAPLPLEQASSADAFVDTIGVQTHINYNDTPYGNWPQVLSALKRLGVRHIRDGLPNDATYLKNHHDLANAKIGCTCGFSIDSKLTTQRIVEYTRLAGDVEALEAPNECDAATNCGGGKALGARNVAAFLPVITAAGKILGLPVLGPSFTMSLGYNSTGDLSPLMTYNNLHIYFGGKNPGHKGWGDGDPQGHRYGSFEWWMDQANLNAPGKPDLITETGYMAYPLPKGPGTIPEELEASYTPRLLLLAWQHGIRRTFLYELLDEFPDTGYGLLRQNLSAKPAFLAVQSLITLLGDPGPSFSPAPLRIAVQGAEAPGFTHMLFGRRDGTYILVAWLEREDYNAETNTPLPTAPGSFGLSLDPQYQVAGVQTLTDAGTLKPAPLSTRQTGLPFAVDGHLTVISIVRRTAVSAR